MKNADDLILHFPHLLIAHLIPHLIPQPTMADITPPSSQQNTPQPSIGKTLPDPDPAAMDVDLDEESESIASEGSAKILVPSGAERAEQVGQAAEADADESEDEGDEEIEVEDEAEAEVEAEEEKDKPEKKGKAPLGGPVGLSVPR